jgi:serine/threonine-protein kinase
MKVLHADLADDPSVFKRFEREAQALQKLRHPNIVPFYGLFQSQGQPFLLEEFIEGNSLQGILRERNGQPLPVEETIIYMKGLCAALHYAHANKVVHCDVKPGNVLVNRQGNIFLADFGIAKFIDATTTMTMGGAGTPAYMAPEQIAGRSVAPATDIYALGVMLFEMLAGQRPFRGTETGSEAGGDTPSERVRYAHLHLPPPDPRQINPNLSPVLSQMILRGLTKNPAKRFQSAQDFFFVLCQASQAQPDQVGDMTTIIGEFMPRPLQPVPAQPQRAAATPRPQKKQEMTSSQKGLIGLLITVAVLIFAITGLTIGTIAPSNNPPLLQATLTDLPIPSKTFTLFPPTETLTNAPIPTIEPSRTYVFAADTYTPFSLPTATLTATETNTPTQTPPPTEIVVSTSAPQPLPENQDSCPEGTAAKEPALIAPFSGGQFAIQTVKSYNGDITLVVSGTGQAENRKWSDAFYLFTDNDEVPLTKPSHPNGGILSINKKIVDKFTSYEHPPYNPDHIYTFSITAPGGQILFGVFDSKTFDNSGSYTVVVCQ